MCLGSVHEELNKIGETDGSGDTCSLSCGLVERKDLLQILDAIHGIVQEVNELGFTVSFCSC